MSRVSFGVINVQTFQKESSKSPENFSKVADYIYASGIVSLNHVDFLQSHKILTIIDLTHSKDNRNKESISKLKRLDNIKYLNFQIQDYSTVSMEDMNIILDQIKSEVQAKRNVIVHCIGGVGRTNMVLVAYFVREHNEAIEETIVRLKEMRTLSFTDSQQQFLVDFQNKFIP